MGLREMQRRDMRRPLGGEAFSKLWMRTSPPSLSVVTMYARGERNEKSQMRSGTWFS